MRILQVHNFYRRSGGECGVVRAEKELLETHGHTVLQFTQDSGEIDHYSLFQKGISFVQIPYNLIVARSLSSFIEINKPDIAHIHNVFPLMSPSVYRTLKRHAVPVVQTIHNYRFLCPNGQFFTRGRICEDCQAHGFSSAVKKRCLHNSFTISLLYASAIGLAWKCGNFVDNIDRFIALNRFSAEKLIAGGVPRDKVKISGNFHASFVDSPPQKKKYVLYIGRLSSEKGLLTLLKAWRQVEGLTLIIAGEGPLEAELRDYVRDYALMNIRFTGYVNGMEKNRLLSEALCTIVPSEWYENFPLSVLESLSMGTPVIASRMGGLPEMIEDGITGLLYTAGDADELATAIKTMVNDKRRTQKMSVEAIKTAKSRFGPEQHYRQLMTIYGEVAHTSK